MAIDAERFRDAERRVWAAAGVTPVERTVTLASGGRLRVQELGEGPPVVFLHGVGVGGTSWCTLAAALQGSRCVLVDRPGCGLSDPIVGGPLRDLAAVHAYADRLLPDILDALALERAAVASTSYGGLFAFRGAATAPDRVDRIVEYSWSMGAPARKPPFVTRLGGIPGMQTFMTRMPVSRRMLKPMLGQFGLRKAIASGAFDDTMLDWMLSVFRDTDTFRNDLASSPMVITPIRGVNPDVLLTAERLSRLTMPVLLLWGADDPNGGATEARAFASHLPNAELVLLDGAEHAPWFDDLSTCVARTQAFLAA
jgi:pimeloyl-ACP methyl ester carboxylesterase